MTERTAQHDYGIPKLSDVDKVSIVACSKYILNNEGNCSIKTLAEKLKVPLMTEHRNRFSIVNRILQPLEKPEKPPTKPMCQLDLAKALIASLTSRSSAIRYTIGGSERAVIAPWFRSDCFHIMKSLNATSFELADLVGLPRSTVLNFSSEKPLPPTRNLSDDEIFILDAWNNAPRHARKSLESFWCHFGKTYPDASFSYETVRQTTRNLGLRSHYGIEKNEGVTNQRVFAPLSYWSADGKFLDVSINGVTHRWLWYAFGCTGTSLFVGASVTKSENSQAFLDALKDSKASTGYFPVGVLIDNRLGRQKAFDLSSSEKIELPQDVLAFCKEHNIVLVHSWPGNPKSNLMENHFSVFAQHVKTIDIKGTTNEELSASIAMAVVESFMKVRNNTPRRRFGGKTPLDLAEGKIPDEGDRPAIEKLKNRVSKNHKSFEDRWALLIPETLACFVSLDTDGNPSRRMQKLLGKYTLDEIIAAQAAFHAQKEKHPDKNYGEDYFFGILRRKREERAKLIYSDVFRAGIHLQTKLPSYTSNLSDFARTIIEHLSALEDEKSPVHQRYQLQALMFFLMSISTQVSLPLLWKTVLQGLVRSNLVSLRWFSTIQEFCHEHLGHVLYEFPREEDEKSPANTRGPPTLTDRYIESHMQ
jgi:hypothetical protein